MKKIISIGCVFLWVFFCGKRVVGFLGCFNFLIVLFMSKTVELLFLSRPLLHGFELSHRTVCLSSPMKKMRNTLAIYAWFAGILIILIAWSKSITATLTLMLKIKTGKKKTKKNPKNP